MTDKVKVEEEPEISEAAQKMMQWMEEKAECKIAPRGEHENYRWGWHEEEEAIIVMYDDGELVEEYLGITSYEDAEEIMADPNSSPTSSWVGEGAAQRWLDGKRPNHHFMFWDREKRDLT